MKHKILVAVCLVAMFTLGVASVRAYDHYKVQQRVQTAVQAQKQKNLEADQKLHEERAAQELKRIQAECQKSLSAYNLLTPAQQVKTAKPNCTLNTVQ